MRYAAREREFRTASLPASNAVRWVPSRKATLVRGVQAGLLSFEEACSRYSISAHEFSVWQNRLSRHGLRGLRISHSGEVPCTTSRCSRSRSGG
jgi:hypothetical protein